METRSGTIQRPSLAPSSESYERLAHSDSSHADYVVINWCLGNLCNYSCSYCPEGLHNGSSPWPTLEEAVHFVDRVFDHYGSKKKYFFEFTGGEVSLYKDLPRFFLYLKSKGARVGLISNGSRSLDYWTKLKPSIDQICLSFHPESAKPDHYLAVIKLLSETVRTHVNIMMSPPHFDMCQDLVQEVVKIPNLSLALQPLLKDLSGDVYPYPEEQKKIIDSQYEMFAKNIKFTKNFEHYRGAMICIDRKGDKLRVSPHKFISSDTHRWEGWECYAGVEQFVIDMSGEIYRGWCKVGGLIGHIKDPYLELPTKPIRCSKSECHCNFDIMCTKVKPVAPKFGLFSWMRRSD